MNKHLFAHVKWFVDDNLPNTTPLSTIEWLIVIGLTILGIVLLKYIEEVSFYKSASKNITKKISKFAYVIPNVIRYTIAALIFINASKSLLFAPNVATSSSSMGGVISALLLVCAFLMMFKKTVAFAGAGMLIAYILSLASIMPVINVLDHVEYIGIGLYLLLYSNKPYVLSPTVRKFRLLLSPESLVRIFVGLGVAILALSEKLVGIANSTDFLAVHNWNFLQFAGLGDREFIIIAGIIELLVGITLVLNIAPRLTTAIVALLMTVTAILLGFEEVFGHLFIFSLVVVVWLSPSMDHSIKVAKNKE